MAINLTINGTAYSFPEPNDNDWGQDVTDWASAITSGTVQKEGGNVEFLNDLDIGTSSGVISNYYKSRSVDIADDGTLRLSNTDTIQWRNVTNDGNVVLSLDGNTLKIDGESVGYRFLSELEDVDITTQLSGDYLTYNGTEWVNKVIEINDISEIIITTPTTKDVLYYDGTNFVNKSIELNDIDNVIINAPNTTEFIGFNGTDFVNKEVKFNDITEVNVATPVDKEYLTYNGAEWVNKTVDLDELSDVTINTPQDRESLIYDSVNNVFINTTPLLSDNADVNLTSPNAQDTLYFDGIEWVNQQLDVNDLSSVNVTTPTDKDYMYYDGNDWINRPINVSNDFGEDIKTIIGDVTKDINGFPTRVDSVITFNDVDKSVTITPINTEFDVMYRGKTITIDAPQTLNFNQVSGGRYINIDPVTGQLIEGNANPSIINDLLCAYVYYNATSDKIVIKGDERHSSSRDTTWHRSKHIEQGMIHRSGGALSYTLANPNTITVGVATPLVVADEDLDHAIIHSDTPTNPFEQILDSNAQIPVIYIDNTGYYTQDDPTTTPYKMGTNNIAYNKITAGVGSQVDVDNGKFMNYYIIATHCTKYPVKVIQGREQHDTEAQAQQESLQALNLPFPELTAIHQLIVQVDTSITENPFKITLIAVLQPVKDMFSGTIIGSVSGSSAADHEELTGRSKPDSHPASAIRDSTYNQTLQDTLDDIVSEAEAEAGVSTIRRSWTAERVKQTALSVIAPQLGSFIKRSVFNSSTTWTPDPKTRFVVIEAIGGGGGGGARAVQNTAATPCGGSGGQYLSTRIGNINGTGSATIVVGAGGTGGNGLTSNMNGGSGGETSFTGYGVTLVAAGGSGGQFQDTLAIHRQPTGLGANNNVYKDVRLMKDSSNRFRMFPAGYGGSGGVASGPGAFTDGGTGLDRIGGNGGMLSAGGGGGTDVQLASRDWRGGSSAVAGSGGYGVCRYNSASYGGHGQAPGGGGGAAGNYTTTLTTLGGSGARGRVIVWEFK